MGLEWKRGWMAGFTAAPLFGGNGVMGKPQSLNTNVRAIRAEHDQRNIRDCMSYLDTTIKQSAFPSQR